LGAIFLRVLALNFSGIDNIDNEGLENLITSIKPKTKLTELRLNFSDCKEISEQSILQLKKRVESL